MAQRRWHTHPVAVLSRRQPASTSRGGGSIRLGRLALCVASAHATGRPRRAVMPQLAARNWQPTHRRHPCDHQLRQGAPLPSASQAVAHQAACWQARYTNHAQLQAVLGSCAVRATQVDCVCCTRLLARDRVRDGASELQVSMRHDDNTLPDRGNIAAARRGATVSCCTWLHGLAGPPRCASCRGRIPGTDYVRSTC